MNLLDKILHFFGLVRLKKAEATERLLIMATEGIDEDNLFHKNVESWLLTRLYQYELNEIDIKEIPWNSKTKKYFDTLRDELKSDLMVNNS